MAVEAFGLVLGMVIVGSLILIFVAIDIAVIGRVVRSFRHQGTFSRAGIEPLNPLERLNQRLASGDISEDDYIRIKALLSDSPYAEKAKRNENIRLSDDGELVTVDDAQKHATTSAAYHE